MCGYMENEKVSIIVPVYNVEKYLAQCIDSVLGQTYVNWELLLIDDGSSDGSPELCDGYAEKDSRVRVIHQANQGASTARNRGLDEATGTYVMFVDSDDYIASGMVSRMVNVIHDTKTDLVLCGYERFTDTYQDKRSYSETPVTILKNKAEIARLYTKPNTNMFGISIWAKLYRNDVLQDKHVRFDPHISYEEDCQFNIDYFELINNAAVIKEVFYHYRQMDVSLSKGFKRNTFEFLIAGYNRRIGFVKKYAPKTSLNGLHAILLVVVKNTMIKIQKSSLKFTEKIKEHRKVMAYDEVQNIVRVLGKSKNALTRILQYIIPLKSGFVAFVALSMWELYNKLRNRK
ncbi:MAG: glycosyltransferase [Solobacterium sp.]|nr:glycosyltransferase [Solobacterium sp.]